MNVTKLLQFYEQRRESGEPLVLVTVFETEGSTYSKAGAQMLVDRNGVFRGMLSGGCLEGDLAVRAGQVLDSGKPQVATYDLGQDDELWGMGAGCDGLMRMVLQPLRAESGYAPFATIAEILRGDSARELTFDAGSDEVVHQLVNSREVVSLLNPVKVAVVTLATLIVEADHALAVHHIDHTILVQML